MTPKNLERAKEHAARLMKVCEYYKTDAAGLARKIGLKKPDKIYNILNLKNGISPEIGDLISTKLNIGYLWLREGLGGEDIVFADNENTNMTDSEKIKELLQKIKDRDEEIEKYRKLSDTLEERYGRIISRQAELIDKLTGK
jgi:hypothetical protein